MPLKIGSRLHAYEITGAIGAGGMGEVYRAHDARLGRDVAVKVLPASLSSEPSALARFEREGRVIGALNHPNVVNVFDTGTVDGVTYVVMELLEGETLRARLQKSAPHAPVAPATKSGTKTSGSMPHGGLSRKRALEIAHQIAQGLAAAHARGIVHRDLKPENIFLTTDGRVKILDFGLARAVGDGVAVGDTQTRVSPQIDAGSVPGIVLGTVGYMAPEQVRGHAVDHRADIFAFGAVLYEMVTGERAFDGESPIETMSAILNAEPLERPVATVAISGPLEPLLRHCLEKSPDERFQSARDLAFQLQALASGAFSASGVERTVAQRPARARRILAAGVTLAALAVGFTAGYLFRSTPPESVTLSMPLPPELRIAPPNTPARSGGIAVSRDGRQIAFVASRGSSPAQIFVRGLDSPVVRAIPGTEGALAPSWSPDGRRLAFWQAGKLRQIALDGGAVQTIADMPNPRSAAAWGDDDVLLYHAEYRGALMRVSAAGGTPAVVLPSPAADVSWFSPAWLPDGRRFLVSRFAYADDAASDAGIYVGAVDSGDMTLLVPGRIAELAIGDGQLFYRRGTELVAQPFDARTAKLSAETQVLSNHASMVAAAARTLVYFDPPGGLSLGQRITWFSRNGEVLSRSEAGVFRDPRLSPDDRLLAVARADAHGLFSVWTYDLARDVDWRVTGATSVQPVWTPDGQSIVVGTGSRLLRFDAAAAGEPQRVRQIPTAGTLDISPDGRDALVRIESSSGVQLAAIALDGSGDPRPIGAPQAVPPQAAFSPDGNWLALTMHDGNATRLFVQPYPTPGPRITVTASQAGHPRWRRDGRELYFIGPETSGAGILGTAATAAVMALPVSWTPIGPEFGQARRLFALERAVLVNQALDVSRDGQRFVAIIADDPEPSPLTVRLRIGG